MRIVASGLRSRTVTAGEESHLALKIIIFNTIMLAQLCREFNRIFLFGYTNSHIRNIPYKLTILLGKSSSLYSGYTGGSIFTGISGMDCFFYESLL